VEEKEGEEEGERGERRDERGQWVVGMIRSNFKDKKG